MKLATVVIPINFHAITRTDLIYCKIYPIDQAINKLISIITCGLCNGTLSISIMAIIFIHTISKKIGNNILNKKIHITPPFVNNTKYSFLKRDCYIENYV